MYPDHVRQLHDWDFTFLRIALDQPLGECEARWFFFEIQHEQESVSTPIGNIIQIQVASPLEVHHLADELVNVAIYNATTGIYASQLNRFFRLLADEMKLRTPRPVEIDLYELLLCTGKAADQYLISQSLSRDLFPRSDSPRVDRETSEYIHQFRSGKSLHKNPYTGQGFHAWFDIACK